MNKRTIGKEYEEKACRYLEERGVAILERNFRCRQGEIDIIGIHGEYLVFAEVKYRATAYSGNAAEAVTAAKQRRICRTADYYRYRHRIGDERAVRYDVIAIQGAGEKIAINWYRNAFFHVWK
ncbi:MAG TPA: YraN family protein [Lachnospiraceae bacterium]|nr:YraN family protein [Lachnospiraceae bacterium]